MKEIIFTERKSVEQIEEGNSFCPRFNENSLIPCITVEKNTNDILMFSYVNKEGLIKSIQSKKAYYFSRSRNKLWLKGEVSGMYHNIHDIYVDDDQDCIIYEVSLEKPVKGGEKASCHVGYKSCFYRKIDFEKQKVSLKFTENKKLFDPNIVYKDIQNPTKI